MARVRATGLARFRFQRFAVPLRIAEVTVRLHKVIDRKVILPVIKSCASSDDLFELNHAIDRTHQDDVADIAARFGSGRKR